MIKILLIHWTNYSIKIITLQQNKAYSSVLICSAVRIFIRFSFDKFD